MLSDAERERMVGATVQIIESSLNSSALFVEACSLSKKMKLGDQTSDSTIRGARINENLEMEKFLRVTCASRLSLAEKGDSLLFRLKTPILAQQIIDISQEASAHNEFLLSESQREKLLTVLKLLQLSVEKSCFIQDMFLSMLLRCSLSLEVLWSLHNVSAIHIDTFLTSKLKGDEEYHMKLSKALVALCLGPPNTLHLRQKILSDFTVFLTKQAFCDKKTNTGQLAKRALNSVLEGVIDLSDLDIKGANLALPSNFLATSEIIKPEYVHKFAVHSLSLILAHGVGKGVQEYMKSEVDWKLCKTSGIILQIMIEFFVPLRCSEVVGVLMRALENQSINSVHVFTYLTAFYTSFSEASATMKGELQMLISSALEKSNSTELYTPFYLAQLSCAAGSHCFPSYSEWFQATFCNSSSLVLSKASYTLLIKFLIGLVPWESPERLKVYIFHKPTLPENCKDLYEDFVDIAKTRLMDLGVPLRETITSMYGNSSYSDATGSLTNDLVNKVMATDTTEQDVLRAVASFQESRKIPTILMQASIFQKPYFIGKFLPALLKPRVLPDFPDDRMLLIAELNKSGKIQALAYEQYLKACDREKQALLEGVFDVDDDDDEMVELTLPMLEQLQRRLDRFTDATLKEAVDVQNGCLKSVIEKVATITAESSMSLTENSSNLSNMNVAVDLSQPSCLSTDNICEINRLLLKTMASVVTQWRDQPRAEQENRSLPTTLSKAYVRLTQTLIQKCPVLLSSICSFVLRIFNQKGAETVDLSNPGLPLMCLCLVNLTSTVILPSERKGHLEDKSFMETVVSILDIINGNESVLRFCVDYAQIACDWLTSIEDQLAQQDVVELGSTCVTDKDLLPPAFVLKVNFVCRRRGLMENSESLPFSVEQGKLARQAYILYMKGQWQQLCIKHKMSLVEWMEMEWSVIATEDPLSPPERLSYMLKISDTYLHTSCELPNFCKTVLLTLAKLCGYQSGCDSMNIHLKSSGFLHLLRTLLEHLRECGENELPLLLQVLQCSEDFTDQIIKFALELPSHLMFCNSQHQNFQSKHIATTLDTIKYFTMSSQNVGAYLSLEATNYILKGMEILGTTLSLMPETALSSVLVQPVVFISLLFHSALKSTVNILDTSKTIFARWSSIVRDIEKWVQRLTEKELFQLTDDQDVLCLEDWQKAAALFSCILLRKCPTDLSKLRLNEKVQLPLLQMLAVNLTIDRSNTSEGIMMLPKQNAVARSFIEILVNGPEVLKHLLSCECKLRNDLGIKNLSELDYLHNAVILRLAMNVPANIILQCQPHNVITSVVAAYHRILTNTQVEASNWQDCFQLDLSAWIKSLVDFSSPEHLDSIPELSFRLENQDVLLFKYIQEKKRQKRK